MKTMLFGGINIDQAISYWVQLYIIYAELKFVW